MTRPKQFAAEAAKEITIAAVTSSPNTAAWAAKDKVAEFYKMMYETILETVKDINNDDD